MSQPLHETLFASQAEMDLPDSLLTSKKYSVTLFVSLV